MARNRPSYEDDDTPAPRGHNSGADPYAVSADELKQFIERIEELEAEKADIAEQMKETFAEARGRGYDTKSMRTIIKMRKKSEDERAEEQAFLDTYLQALGMI